jgi:hypothetical protein
MGKDVMVLRRISSLESSGLHPPVVDLQIGTEPESEISSAGTETGQSATSLQIH